MIDHRVDPSALRFLIGHDLRTMRERAGVKQVEAAEALGCSQPKINHLESGRTQQQPEQVAILLKRYGAGAEHIDRMASLASRADQGTWWAPFGDALPDWFKTFVGLEGLATSAFAYRSLVVPGQLQTAEYAAALLIGNLRVAPMDAPHVIAARMARQRLIGPNPLRLRAVVEQHVLDRLVGGPLVMRAQLEHLLTSMRLDHVDLRVMPVEVAVHDGLDGDFLLLDFEQAQGIGYVEYPNGALYVQDQDHVAAFRMAADRLCAAALSGSESADLIAARIAALDARSGGPR